MVSVAIAKVSIDPTSFGGLAAQVKTVAASTFAFAFGPLTTRFPELLLACYTVSRGSSTNPTTPTVTDTSARTWELITSLNWVSSGTTRRTSFVFAAYNNSSTADTLSFAHGVSHLTSILLFVAFEGSIDKTVSAANNVVQNSKTSAGPSGTGFSLNLANSGLNIGSRSFLFHFVALNQSPLTASADWSFLQSAGSTTNTAGTAQVIWNSNFFDPSVSTSWPSSSAYGGIMMELKCK